MVESRWAQKAESSCDDPKEVTLHVLNTLSERPLDQWLTLKCTRQKYLLGMMEEAADQDSFFRFSGTYFNQELGWFVDAFNEVYATKGQTYWQIQDGDMQPTKLGASHYQPKNGETVTFNLTLDNSNCE